ncbi:MAG TPA: flavodoxin domain-containing protein [Acidimicrobiales bacterium]|nr:flavodoxin domain-containing protein [Acidimicrobiales bacterium]
MTVLVAYGSKRGGTEGLAKMVGAALREEGFAADVRPARRVGDISGYQAVIVGGALYALRWHRDARRFVRRHAAELWARPTYLFSSGPLDDSARSGDIPPVKGVRAAMDRIGATGHMTFGGRLTPDAKGFPAKAMAKKNAGDWRDEGHVREWVHTIAATLRAPATRPAARRPIDT